MTEIDETRSLFLHCGSCLGQGRPGNPKEVIIHAEEEAYPQGSIEVVCECGQQIGRFPMNVGPILDRGCSLHPADQAGP